MIERTTITTYRGRQYRRKEITRRDTAPRREIIWQAAESDPSWGYWYSTRRQAERESNASDRVIAHDCRCR